MKKKRLIALAATLVVSATSAVSVAQSCPTGTEKVLSGDTLWAFKGPQWRTLVTANPSLADKKRWREETPDKVIVAIWPGECLAGVKRGDDGKLVPPLPPFPPEEQAASQVTELQPPIATPWWFVETPEWLKWLLLAIVGLTVLAWLLLSRMLNKDAATAGPAMVPGGVTSEAAPFQFQDAAFRRHHARTGDFLPRSDFVVLSSVRGRICGVLLTRYASRLRRAVPRRFYGEPAFQAQVRMPDGSIETFYLLQACGNELRQTGVTRQLPGPDFMFVPDPVADPGVAPVPVQVPAAPVQQAPAADSEVARVTSISPETDALLRHLEGGAATVPLASLATATLDYKPPTKSGKPHLIQVCGNIGFSVTVGADGVTVRLNEPNK